MNTLAEIQDAILRLSPQDRETLRSWLDDSEEESPAMLAFIDGGLQSLATEPHIPIEEVAKKIRRWATG